MDHRTEQSYQSLTVAPVRRREDPFDPFACVQRSRTNLAKYSQGAVPHAVAVEDRRKRRCSGDADGSVVHFQARTG